MTRNGLGLMWDEVQPTYDPLNGPEGLRQQMFGRMGSQGYRSRSGPPALGDQAAAPSGSPDPTLHFPTHSRGTAGTGDPRVPLCRIGGGAPGDPVHASPPQGGEVAGSGDPRVPGEQRPAPRHQGGTLRPEEPRRSLRGGDGEQQDQRSFFEIQNRLPGANICYKKYSNSKIFENKL